MVYDIFVRMERSPIQPTIKSNKTSRLAPDNTWDSSSPQVHKLRGGDGCPIIIHFVPVGIGYNLNMDMCIVEKVGNS